MGNLPPRSRAECPRPLPPRPHSMSHMRHEIGTWEIGDLGWANLLPGRAAPESIQVGPRFFRSESRARGDQNLTPFRKAHPLQIAPRGWCIVNSGFPVLSGSVASAHRAQAHAHDHNKARPDVPGNGRPDDGRCLRLAAGRAHARTRGRVAEVGRGRLGSAGTTVGSQPGVGGVADLGGGTRGSLVAAPGRPIRNLRGAPRSGTIGRASPCRGRGRNTGCRSTASRVSAGALAHAAGGARGIRDHPAADRIPAAEPVHLPDAPRVHGLFPGLRQRRRRWRRLSPRTTRSFAATQSCSRRPTTGRQFHHAGAVVRREHDLLCVRRTVGHQTRFLFGRSPVVSSLSRCARRFRPAPAYLRSRGRFRSVPAARWRAGVYVDPSRGICALQQCVGTVRHVHLASHGRGRRQSPGVVGARNQ